MRLALTMAAAAAFCLSGCEPQVEEENGKTQTIKAKHGGTVINLAANGPAMEVVYDEAAGTIKLSVYTSKGEPQKLDGTPTVNLDKGPTEVTGTGADDQWTFTHENLKDHPHATFVLMIGGKSYNNNEWHPEDDH